MPPARAPATLVIFDVLQARGADLRVLPLSARKEWLRTNLEPRSGLQVIETVETYGEALFALTVDQDFEGIVAKNLDAPYLAVDLSDTRAAERAITRWHR